jgi:hypothetical protein
VIEIPLTRGYVALVDDEDYPTLAAFPWHVTKRGSCLYAARIAHLSVGARPILMHRTLLSDPAGQVDHVNGNGLDNRRANLRLATSSQNQANQRAQVGKSSRYKGVQRHTQRPIWWVAGIVIDGRRRYIGIYRNEEDAALAYDAKAREVHGPYAALNFPNPGEQSAHRAEIGAA